MSLLRNVAAQIIEKKVEVEPEQDLTCLRPGSVVRLKEGVGSPRDNTRVKELLESVSGAVALHDLLDGSALWNVSDLEVMTSPGVFEAAKTSMRDAIFVVYLPANVYAGKYYEFKTAQVKVLASSKEEATEIVNKNQDDVLRFLATRRVQPSGRPLIPSKESSKKNVFFKDSYYIKELPVRSSNDVMTRHGGFKTVRLDKIDEAYGVKATVSQAAEYLYTLLKNSKAGRKADWKKPVLESPTTVKFECRYFGEWEVPSDEEDDGDHDWQVPTQFTIRHIDDIIKTSSKHYPDFKVDVLVEEKNWLIFSVAPRS